MRVLIVAAVLACAAAAPSGLLAAPYAHGLIGHAPYAVAHAAPLALAHAGPALPTISPGDIAGAAIEAHVDASDHARAAVDATRELHDQASEIQGQAINAAEDHSWQAVDAVKTVEAQLDGAAAGVAPVLAKQLVGHGAVGAYAGSGIAAHGITSGIASYGVPAYGHAIAAPVAHGASQTIVRQSLSQTHPAPAPVVHAATYVHAAPYAHAVPYAHGGSYGHGVHGW